MTPSRASSQHFKEWRRRMGWTVNDAARYLGLGLTCIYHYETGKRSDVGREVRVPKVVALACVALEAKLKPLGEDAKC